ncbi:hypothetical protein [Acidiphilium rubrum]|uniref:hypothetical protein n=1 Tax=Acidiphilium rubrum TaxID=526 RepID=UPI002D1FB2F6|nr:hypothetical protein [Acidiphilium rubrum]
MFDQFLFNRRFNRAGAGKSRKRPAVPHHGCVICADTPEDCRTVPPQPPGP